MAEAHQWLNLGQPARTWNTVRWFWNHQASPGLFTWWEGKDEENTFHRWEQVRGWVNPPHVTPHYGTAAEMLLLQLDMLARIDQSTVGPVLVIGAGRPFRPTPRCVCDEWDGPGIPARGWANLHCHLVRKNWRHLCPQFHRSKENHN